MRWLGALVVALLAGGVVAAGAAAQAQGAAPVHLRPAATSVDHAPFCDVPVPDVAAAPAAGGTLVTFTLLPLGCE